MKYYAGIGSRQTPNKLKPIINKIVMLLNEQNYILRSDGLEKLNKMWKHCKLPGDVIGITKNYCANEDLKWKDRKERGNEIQEYLDTHPEISNYVIIDDDNDMLDSQQKKYVKTNPQYGITDIVANKSIKILCKV
jgi:hypothetical protein